MKFESTDPGSTSYNFDATISDLKKRALRARQSRTTIAVGMLAIIMIAVVAIYSLNTRPAMAWQTFAESISAKRPQDPGLFMQTTTRLLDRAYPDGLVYLGKRLDGSDEQTPVVSPEQRAAYLNEINTLVGFYERAEAAYKTKALESSSAGGGLITSISSIAFTFGAIAFFVLGIQIGMSFLRYYARLAELYDAQASALMISNGDPDKAIKFFEVFSPMDVSFGKVPASLYERAIEAVTAAKDKIR